MKQTLSVVSLVSMLANVHGMDLKDFRRYSLPTTPVSSPKNISKKNLIHRDMPHERLVSVRRMFQRFSFPVSGNGLMCNFENSFVYHTAIGRFRATAGLAPYTPPRTPPRMLTSKCVYSGYQSNEKSIQDCICAYTYIAEWLIKAYDGEKHILDFIRIAEEGIQNNVEKISDTKKCIKVCNHIIETFSKFNAEETLDCKKSVRTHIVELFKQNQIQNYEKENQKLLRQILDLRRKISKEEENPKKDRDVSPRNTVTKDSQHIVIPLSDQKDQLLSFYKEENERLKQRGEFLKKKLQSCKFQGVDFDKALVKYTFLGSNDGSDSADLDS